HYVGTTSTGKTSVYRVGCGVSRNLSIQIIFIMVQVSAQLLTLAKFLQLPETKPASEYIDGQISQKPMPQGKHSTL
ncbi:MAG: Uma2 family endonuclease, partial [Geitlerinemataceae cyanobacterium]